MWVLIAISGATLRVTSIGVWDGVRLQDLSSPTLADT
jgi:hypothetical protein